MAAVHIPTWIIGPAIKVGEKVYDWLGSRFGIRVEAALGVVGQGQVTKEAVLVHVYNRTDRPETVNGIYLGFSHDAGVLYYTPGPGFPSIPSLPRPCSRTENVTFAFPLDQVKQELVAVRAKKGKPRIEVSRVRVELASGRGLWRQAKLGQL